VVRAASGRIEALDHGRDVTRRFTTRRFTALPRQKREALIDAKEAEFRERLARELEALGSAPKPAGGRWRAGKEHLMARAVRTPAGVFDSARQASEAFEISPQHASRLARERRRGWSYVGS
jgi:hypothetical protein